jgi:hypothetical protein
LMDEPDAPARAAAEIALRRALLPGHSLTFAEPALREDTAARWHAVVGALLADAGPVETIIRRSHPNLVGTTAMRAVAASLGQSRVAPVLTGVAAAHAAGAVAAALATIGALEDRGWGALVDSPLGIQSNIGAEAVAERTESFDPLTIEAGSRV